MDDERPVSHDGVSGQDTAVDSDGGVRSGRRLTTKKREANASEILDAAAIAFGRRGYSATSIDDVADVLGCTKGRVYHYFRTKGDLFIGIHRRALVWALEAVEPVAQQSDRTPSDRLREMVRRHALHLMEHADYMGPAQYHTEVNLAREGRSKDAAIREIFEMRHRFESYFATVLAAGMDSGEFRAGDAAILTKAVLGSVNWMSVWYRTGSAFDTPDGRELIAEEFSTFVLNGMLASPR